MVKLTGYGQSSVLDADGKPGPVRSYLRLKDDGSGNSIEVPVADNDLALLVRFLNEDAIGGEALPEAEESPSTDGDNSPVDPTLPDVDLEPEGDVPQEGQETNEIPDSVFPGGE